MFSLTIRRHFMIAHSLPRPVFGPAQGMHGATFVAEVSFRRRDLTDDSIVLDIGAAGDLVDEVLEELNYRNLDEHDAFRDVVTTTEVLARYVAERVAVVVQAAPDAEGLAGIDVTLREHPDAWASYSLELPS